ncbi:outer membrane protein assembly factor BamE [Paraburkholderia dinghuensis]|uniref:outer membrane protein assembly factor BamE n=1 Tax=Paraburkholderia dinghuensis TaxID=2305225 RepID=UPI00162812A7|nr:outer membrane protein assembly factor BamE [Paraburkholderia dinghuensis]
MSKLFRFAAAVAPLLVLAACASSDKEPEKLIASVSPGLTQTEVMRHLGPPDHVYDYAGRDCFQYALGDKNVPLAVYFDDQGRVVSSTREACKGRMR